MRVFGWLSVALLILLARFSRASKCTVKDFFGFNYLGVADSGVIDTVLNFTFEDSRTSQNLTVSVLYCPEKNVLQCADVSNDQLLMTISDSKGVCLDYFIWDDIKLSTVHLTPKMQGFRLIMGRGRKKLGEESGSYSDFSQISFVHDQLKELAQFEEYQLSSLGQQDSSFEVFRILLPQNPVDRSSFTNFFSLDVMYWVDMLLKVFYLLLYFFCMLYSNLRSAPVMKIQPLKFYLSLSVANRLCSFFVFVVWDNVEGLNGSLMSVVANLMIATCLLLFWMKRNPNFFYNRLVPVYHGLCFVFLANNMWFCGVVPALAGVAYYLGFFFLGSYSSLIDDTAEWHLSVSAVSDFVPLMFYLWNWNFFLTLKTNYYRMQQIFQKDLIFVACMGFVLCIPVFAHLRLKWSRHKMELEVSRKMTSKNTDFYQTIKDNSRSMNMNEVVV